MPMKQHLLNTRATESDGDI